MSSIGSTCSRARILLHSFGLVWFQSILRPQDFQDIARRIGCVPRKTCRLTPEVVCWLMMLVNLHGTSMTQGLTRAWSWVRDTCLHTSSGTVSEEAFCQARRKLPLRFWRALAECLSNRYEQRFAAAMRWKGLFRVLAGDGSEVRLPAVPELVRFFGCPKNGQRTSHQPQGRLVAFCSVFTGFCVAFKFVSLRFSEHTVLRHLIAKLKINDLLLLDRGFFSFAALWRILQQKAHYLMRLSRQAAGWARRMQRLGPDEWLVRFRISAYCRRRCPGLPEVITARLIRYQRPGFRSSWLLTSLTDTDLCSRQELVDLYHRRWSIETIYREWKHSLDIQNLRSHTPAGILKEIHAQILMSNLVRWTMTKAIQGTDQTPIDLSFLTTLSLIQNAVGTSMPKRGPCYVALSQQLLMNIQTTRIRKRPGRSYPRPQDGKIKSKGHGKYQLPARLTKRKSA